MRRLRLHIGHGKTGTSFLQSALALSEDVLSTNGIHYPDLTNSFPAARAGRITSGNAHVNKRPLIQYAREGHETAPEGASLLFSNEGLFGYFNRNEAPKLLRAIIAEQFRPDVLCFLRDPLEHAVSLYQQTVKRSGNTHEFKGYLKNYRVPTEVLRMMDMCEDLGIPVRFHNYSNHRKTILGLLEDWLELEDGTLVVPERSTVNRSMTNAEIALQLEFNRHLGNQASKLISDPLCDQLPDVKSEYPAIEIEDLKPFLDRMREQMALVNARLPDAERYNVPEAEEAIAGFRSPHDSELLSFSREQLAVIANCICRLIVKLEAES
ncbi:hypothetical protein JSE7799_02187 [Jannaschia seosinensis]|uniref:Sulfotransferase family protein n=1 Tax=Jannaschia seosinensis TaxID=313367 RepID=A0A0M7B9R1_9RHOB|nr:hypothetical protein [Jannaschia seosinensis]CUH39460.1 hypothetical protein JSE7799_02187 [Jannaschia seosinensis]